MSSVQRCMILVPAGEATYLWNDIRLQRVVMFLSTDSGQAAITGRFLSPAKPHQTNRRRTARSVLAARTSSRLKLDPPVLMRLVPPSSAATRAAAEAQKRDRSRADREWKDAWKRMPPAEKRAMQAEWKRAWQQIQAEQRREEGVRDSRA